MKKKLIYIIGFFLIQIIIYEFCYQSNRFLFQRDHEALASLNAIATYNGFKRISLSLNANDESYAKCIAELYAQNKFVVVDECMKNDFCRIQIEETVRKHAPEILNGQAPFKFRRECKKTTK